MIRIPAAILVALLAAFGAAPQASANGACANEEKQGEFAYYRGDYRDSIAFYKQATERPCGATAFWPTFMIAENHCTLGEWNQCAGYARKAVEMHPNNGRAYATLGHALLQLGRTDEAIQWMELGISRDPAHEKLHNNLGAAYLIKGQPATAVRHFQNALYWNEEDPLIYRNLAAALSAQGQWDRAKLYAEETLAVREDDRIAKAIARIAGRGKAQPNLQPLFRPALLSP